MKIFKVYGCKDDRTVYINNEKVSIEQVENSIFCDYKSNFGYGIDNILIVIEDESELAFLDGDCLAEKINPTRVKYSLYKALTKIAGSGFLLAQDYDADTKTIMISKG